LVDSSVLSLTSLIGSGITKFKKLQPFDQRFAFYRMSADRIAIWQYLKIV
jgi:hypothetical protein